MYKKAYIYLIIFVWALDNCFQESTALSRNIRYPRLPHSAKHNMKSVRFIVFTKNRSRGKVFRVGHKTKLLNTSKMTKVLIHGWQNDDESAMPQKLKDAYLRHQDVNVIIVGWGQYAKTLRYDDAVKARTAVAKATVKFIMSNLEVMQPELNVHLIGYSLGAHICADIGLIFRYNDRIIYRITGLDPARPLISNGLEKQNAFFVDVIHTTAGSLGTWVPCGHVDFYPNGGSTPQPNCSAILPQCSHSSSWKYYAKSIRNKKKYRAVHCTSFQNYLFGYCTGHTYMGEGVSIRARGNYYLHTDDGT